MKLNGCREYVPEYDFITKRVILLVMCVVEEAPASVRYGAREARPHINHWALFSAVAASRDKVPNLELD